MNRIEDNVVYIANHASKTSRDAAEKTLPKTGTMRRQILTLIAEHGGLADFEIEKLLREHKLGRNQDHIIWPILMLELWALTWLD